MTQKQRISHLAFCCVVAAMLLLALITLFRADRDSDAPGRVGRDPIQSNPDRRVLIDDKTAGGDDATNDVVQQLRKAGRVNLHGKTR